MDDDGLPWAFVGKIGIDSTMWSWQKQLRQEQLSTISALSASPDGSKLACYGLAWDLAGAASDQGYIFVLDAKNGSIKSRLVHMQHQQPELI